MGDEQEEGFAVFPAGWKTLQLFLALATQWQLATVGLTIAAPMGGTVTHIDSVPVGIRYEAIEPTARGLGIKVTPQMFHWLRGMEIEAAKAFAEKAARR